jgi:hypothetical protein
LWSFKHSFETRPGPVGRPGAGTEPGWEKNRERKNSVWPGGLTRQPSKTRSKTQLQPIDFCFFFTKTTSFWFKIFLTRSKPETRALNQAGSKTMISSLKDFTWDHILEFHNPILYRHIQVLNLKSFYLILYLKTFILG